MSVGIAAVNKRRTNKYTGHHPTDGQQKESAKMIDRRTNVSAAVLGTLQRVMT